MLSRVARSALRQASPRVAMVQTQVRFGGDTPTLTQAQLEQAWVEYFDSDLCDYWYIRRGLRELLMDDMIPSPEISQVSLYHFQPRFNKTRFSLSFMPAEEITICQLLSDSWKFSSTSAVQMKKLMITSCKNLAQQWLISASSPQKNSVLTSLLPNLNKLLIQDEGFVFILFQNVKSNSLSPPFELI